MQKKEEKKTNTQEKAVSIDTFEMVDRLVQNAQQALKEYMELDQEQVDKIVHAMTLAGLDKHMLLAKMAYEETGRGVMEDKVIKNIFSTEYIWHSIKKQKTVGVIDENEMEGYVEVAEPVGVVAGVTPVTNPTSTTMFKSLICAKTRNPIIFGFHRRHRNARHRRRGFCGMRQSKPVRRSTAFSGSRPRRWMRPPL